MASLRVEAPAFIDEKFQLVVSNDFCKTKKIGDFVELVNKRIGGKIIIRIYYHASRILDALRVEVARDETSSIIALSQIAKKNPSAFCYGRNVMIIDRGKYLEILPWPSDNE
jgi:hypothetical protein